MKTRVFLATATAASMLMSAVALADNNAATVKQDGDDNTAVLTQSGTGNDIGDPVATSTWGKVVQTGDNNQMTIVQTGNNNNIADWAGGTAGVRQDGDRNVINVLQQAGTTGYTGNAIHNIDQNALAGSTVASNTLNVTQSGTGVRHVVRNVVQTSVLVVNNSVDTNSITISQTGTAGYELGHVARQVLRNGSGNTLSLTQTGNNNFADILTQSGAGNSGIVSQSGSQNTVALLSQEVGSSLAGGNTASITLSGSKNGTGATGFVTQAGSSAWSTYDAYYSREGFSGTTGAATAGVDQGKVVQNGGGNNASFLIAGDRNLYGSNQLGDQNTASVIVTGNDHQVAVRQQGDNNDTSVTQSGVSNTAGTVMIGNSNHLSITQTQTGGLGVGNEVTANITGDDNGNGPFTGGLLILANASGLSNGDIFQSGDDNSVSLLVTSSLNDFAFKQSGGNGNSITATIGGGNGNRSVGVQNGSDNTAILSQTGATNTAVFNQIGNSNSATITQ